MENILDIGVLVIALLAVITGVIVLVRMLKEENEAKTAHIAVVTTNPKPSTESKPSIEKEKTPVNK